jgi:hypothetical protein
MHEGHRAQRGLTGRSNVQGDPEGLADGSLVHRAQLHPEFVGMLAIVERLPIRGFPRLQQQGIPPVADRGRIEAQHGAQLDATAGQSMAQHQHAPIEGAELRVAPRPSLRIVLPEDEAMEHHVPAAPAELA